MKQEAEEINQIATNRTSSTSLREYRKISDKIGPIYLFVYRPQLSFWSHYARIVVKIFQLLSGVRQGGPRSCRPFIIFLWITWCVFSCILAKLRVSNSRHSNTKFVLQQLHVKIVEQNIKENTLLIGPDMQTTSC